MRHLSRKPVQLFGSRLLSGLIRYGFVLLVALQTNVLFAQSTEPSVSGNVLSIPVVVITDLSYSGVEFPVYSIDFTIADEDGKTVLLPTNVIELDDATRTGSSTYYCIPRTFDCYLNLPHLEINGESYWGEFLLVSIDPYRFELSAAAVNSPGPSGIEGKWRSVSINDSTDCGGTISDETNIIEIRSDAQGLVIDGNPVTQVGNTIEWTATVPEGDGNIELNNSITIEGEDVTGLVSWEYSDGVNSCTGSTEITSAVRLHQ